MEMVKSVHFSEEYPLLTIDDILLCKEITSGVYRICPDFAKEVIALYNNQNRTVSQWKVRGYISDMAEGRWSLNGESISFDWNGQLVNGQHRMWACLRSGVTFESMVVLGADPYSKFTVDQGKARNAGDYFGINGYKNGNEVAAIARAIIAYEQGNFLSHTREKIATPARCGEFAEQYPYIHEVANWACNRKSDVKYLTAKALGFCRWIFEDKYGEVGMDFLKQFLSGEMLRKGDPALTIRKKIEEDKLIAEHQAKLIFMGMAAYAQKKEMHLVKKIEEMPELPKMNRNRKPMSETLEREM